MAQVIGGSNHRALDSEVLVAARMDRSFLNHGWRREVRELAQETVLGNNGKRHGSWAYGCTIGTRRVTFDSLGGFDESLPVRAGEDVEFCGRAAAAGVVLAFVPDAVLRYRFPSSPRAILRQGFTYGHAGAYIEWHAGNLAPTKLRADIRSLLGPTKLVALGPSAGKRAHGLFLLGRRIGMLVAHRQERLGRWQLPPPYCNHPMGSGQNTH